MTFFYSRRLEACITLRLERAVPGGELIGVFTDDVHHVIITQSDRHGVTRCDISLYSSSQEECDQQ